MASFKPIFLYLFILACFLNFLTTTATYDASILQASCSDNNKTTPNSAFERNLRTLLSCLSSNATAANKDFFNATVTGRNPSDTVYGLFMCKGDVPDELCGQCVRNATQSPVLSDPDQCYYLSKDVVIWKEECMFRYSNNSFFSTPDLSSRSASFSSYAKVSNQDRYLFSETMNKMADEAANFSIGVKKYYATKEARISGFQTLYCQAQCTHDLSPQDCRRCLNVTIAAVLDNGKTDMPLEVSAQTTTCYIRCDVSPFDRPSTAPPPSQPVPAASNTDSKFSPLPTYLSHNCSSNNGTLNGSFSSHLTALLSTLSSIATSKISFYKTSSDSTVNGLFTCRGDISPALCQLCVQNATQRISSECPASKEAIIWYDQCLLRYSYRSLLSSSANTSAPKFYQFNLANTPNPNLLQRFFTWTLADTLYKQVRFDQGDSSAIENYRTSSVKLNDDQTIYALSQCTPDLSDDDCYTCLDNIFRYEIPWCCLASPEGKVLYPSCYIMFGLSKFYSDGNDAEAEAFGQALHPPTTTGQEVPSKHDIPPPTTKENEKDTSRTVIIVVPIVLSALLLTFSCYWLRKKARKSSYKTQVLRKNFGDESTTLEGLQFDLARIKAATNNFSQENKIGKGGFGEVYKGILPDGRHIAVKRLSTISKQGLVEFKNEILLIAKLQQRNLVTLIGFCLEEQEKILIYEYVPNGSLDNFLFDTRHQKLSWSERYKIIKGTALGILYLHEHSRLKVIHRDLKPSNVLLDEKMNPKISDFGMARIVEIDQDRGSTNKIAGTFGYMSPEYAMLGQFSEKSDAFSFGVMVLEIITGKRNLNPYESHHVAEGLISYVWRQWKNQTPLSILDPNMEENYSQVEVVKCIQIGLLCVQENPDSRPTMAAVVLYLNSHSPELSPPEEPAFFIHGRMNQEIIAQLESNSGQSTKNFMSFSVNEMSMSEFYPR